MKKIQTLTLPSTALFLWKVNLIHKFIRIQSIDNCTESFPIRLLTKMELNNLLEYIENNFKNPQNIILVKLLYDRLDLL